MLIHEIKIKNILSFGPESRTLLLKPLNVIIGPNGSGKSNLLEVIALLQSLPTDVSKPIRSGSGDVHDWFWKGSAQRPATVECVFDMIYLPAITDEHSARREQLRYSVEFVDSMDSLAICGELLEKAFLDQNFSNQPFYRRTPDTLEADVLASGGKLESFSASHKQSILVQLRHPVSYPEITFLAEELPQIRIYRDWSFGRNTPPRLPQPADMPNQWLEEDASNLGLVLNRLTRDFATKNKMLKYFRAIYEDARDFNVIVEGGRVQVFVQEEKFSIPATRLSDGTLRYLSLLAILLDPTPPPLICIDEPELGLHHDLINNVVELMKDASERTQLIVTTHSDYLVDAFSDDPEAVMVCERHNGCTNLLRLEADRMKKWLGNYRLGELWSSGEIGGNRW